MGTKKRTNQRKNIKAANSTTQPTRSRSTRASTPVGVSDASTTPAARTLTRKRTTAPMTLRAPRRPTQQEIAQRAYELYERRGYTHGDDMADWLRAERELLGIL